MKEHEHKWYETSLAKSKTQKSFACECGSWKVESVVPGYTELVNYKIKK